jgi:hypothetical protein
MTFKEAVIALETGKCERIGRGCWGMGYPTLAKLFEVRNNQSIMSDDWEMYGEIKPKQKYREEVIVDIRYTPARICFSNMFGSPPKDSKIYAEWEV